MALVVTPVAVAVVVLQWQWQIRSNTRSDSIEELYKRTVAILIPDNLSAQMDQRFNEKIAMPMVSFLLCHLYF